LFEKIAPYVPSLWDGQQGRKSDIYPCGGGAGKLLQMTPAPIEVYNDIDKDLVNFWHVMGKPKLYKKLIRRLTCTPWSRSEFERLCNLDPTTLSKVARAHRSYVLSRQSMAGVSGDLVKPSDWRYRYQGHSPVKTWVKAVDNLWAVADRWSCVIVESLEAETVIQKYGRSPWSYIYFDPPYPLSTRSRKKAYKHDPLDSWHTQIASILRDCPGYVIVSGRSCDLYTSLYEAFDWVRVDLKTVSNSGNIKPDSLWINPKTWALYQHKTRIENNPLWRLLK